MNRIGPLLAIFSITGFFMFLGLGYLGYVPTDKSAHDAAVHFAQARVIVCEADLAAAKADLDYHTSDLRRSKRLLLQDSTSQQSHSLIVREYEKAVAARDQAVGRLEMAKALVDHAKATGEISSALAH